MPKPLERVHRNREWETRPRWYGTRRWRRIAAAQLLREPLCCMCLADGVVEPARVADHIEPHRGDEAKFWSGELQSLCLSHHNADKQAIEKGGRPRRQRVGPDGWPIGRD